MRPRLQRWAGRVRDEAGSATVFVIGFAMVLFLAAGLAIDGGMAINKRMGVADDAEQAARIGADSIDIEALRAGQGITLDQGLAQQRIGDYLSSLGYGPGQWSARVGQDDVTVEVHDVSKTYILNLFHVRFPVQASAEAVPATGPEGGDGP